MTQCSQQFNNAIFTDLHKQGFMKASGALHHLSDEWVIAFYKDAKQWLAETNSASAKAAVEHYKAEKHRRDL